MITHVFCREDGDDDDGDGGYEEDDWNEDDQYDDMDHDLGKDLDYKLASFIVLDLVVV